MLSEKQKHLRDEVIREVRRHGGFPVSWPSAPRVRFEILDRDVGEQLVDAFERYGMAGCYIGNVSRVTPGGVVPCFAFEVVLPRDKPPLAPAPRSHFGEVMTAEQKRRQKQGLSY